MTKPLKLLNYSNMPTTVLQELFRLIFKSNYKEKIRHIKIFYSIVLKFENWWIYYLDYFNFTNKSPLIFKLKNDRIFYGLTHQMDAIIINEIWGIKNSYLEYPLSIGLHDVVVDIGAHKGYFTVYASSRASQGKIFAFEPFPSNYKLLKKNLEINNCKNVKCYQLGIGGDKAKKRLYLGTNMGQGNSILKNQFNNFGKCKVIDISAIRLQDIFTYCKIDHIDFLKMDIEGAEYEIFLHTPSNIFSKIKFISMEYHNVNNMNEEILVDIFERNNFNVIIKKMRKEFGMLYAIRSQTSPVVKL